jgi:hypothetical protein
MVIGGLSLSTLLTLLIVPASFSLAVGIERWMAPWLARYLLTYRPGDESRPLLERDAATGRIAGRPGAIGYHGDDPQPAE